MDEHIVLNDVVSAIRNAFTGIPLNGGTGLWEAYAKDKEGRGCNVDKYKIKIEEQDDWSRLSVNDLNHCYETLPFMDYKGLMFHLPAFMIASLRRQMNYDIFPSVCTEVGNPQLLCNLSKDQKLAIIGFIKYMLSIDFNADTEDDVIDGQHAINKLQ